MLPEEIESLPEDSDWEMKPIERDPKSNLISDKKWSDTIKKMKISKLDLNKIVMNYLIVEGYKSAAEKFTQEWGIEDNMDFDLIEKRREIRILIQEGKIDEAIEMINDVNPEILDTNDELYFKLKKQKLIELIKNKHIEEALLFSQGVIAEKAAKRTEFLDQMEEVMTLLAFENPKESPLKNLVDSSSRQKLASEVNEAILTNQWVSSEVKLPFLLKMLIWSEKQLGKTLTYPRLITK